MTDFCPECGCDRYIVVTETHRFCNGCGQEWWTDVDYPIQNSKACQAGKQAGINKGMEQAAGIVENQYEQDGKIDQYETAEAIRKEIEK